MDEEKNESVDIKTEDYHIWIDRAITSVSANVLGSLISLRQRITDDMEAEPDVEDRPDEPSLHTVLTNSSNRLYNIESEMLNEISKIQTALFGD